MRDPFDRRGFLKMLPFDAEHPFRNLGPRVHRVLAGAPPSTLSLRAEELSELAARVVAEAVHESGR